MDDGAEAERRLFLWSLGGPLVLGGRAVQRKESRETDSGVGLYPSSPAMYVGSIIIEGRVSLLAHSSE